MPDYTYLKSRVKAEKDAKENDARRKHEEFVDRFNQQKEAMVSLLIKACKEYVERRVRTFYEIGKKEYSKRYSPSRDGRGIIPPSFFKDYYELNDFLLHTVQISGRTFNVNIMIEIRSSLPKHCKIMHTEARWLGDEDERVDCRFYFPSEEHLDDIVDAVNVALEEDEVELIILSHYGGPPQFGVYANLGTL